MASSMCLAISRFWSEAELAAEFIFDEPHARRFAEARQAMLRPILSDLRERLQIRSVADMGCGVGYFSGFLRDLGFEVAGFDGRPQNIEEAKRRNSGIEFRHADVEDPSIIDLGPYDMVLCVGLLYHLENPLRALRNLSAMAGRLLLIESYATPQKETALYLREEPALDDQSLTSLALYPSESALIKICYKIGFPWVYRFVSFPNHEDFKDCIGRKRQRTMLLASRSPLDIPCLTLVPEPQDLSDPWQTPTGKLLGLWGRLKLWIGAKRTKKAFELKTGPEAGRGIR
ncbi:MAG: class I SAM-dependent methyltransferase [Candidatus Acidiferrales bacterium]